MNDATRRALRTLFQVGSVSALIGLYNAFAPQPLNSAQVGALTTFGTLAVSFVQNLLEDTGTIPAIGKPPSGDGG